MKLEYTREILIYIIIILLLSLGLTWICNKCSITLSRDISATATAAIAGYSFTALFFLMALPRTGFIEKAEKEGKINVYGIVVGMPALTGAAQLILNSLGVYNTVNLLLFFMTAFWFMLSAIYIFLIMAKNRSYKPSKNTSK